MISPIRILAVDDHELLRKGIAAILASQPDIIMVAEASNGREAVDQYRTHRPDITLMDLQMPSMNGLDAMVTILAEFPNARIIVLTTYVGDVQILRAMKAGAVDFLTKPVRDKDLLDAIVRAEQEDTRTRQTSAEVAAIEAKIATLTPREREVLTHVIAGRLNKQIAGDLGTVEKTIKVHRGRMMEKLGVHTVVDLVRLAEKAGIAAHGK